MVDRNGHNGKVDLSWITSFEPVDLSFIDVDVSNQDLTRLSEKVVDLIGKPMDSYAVTATLESMGWRDIDAKEVFGKNDLFELGSEIYHYCMVHSNGNGKGDEKKRNSKGENSIASFFRYYARGSLFMLPIVTQILALFIFRFSLWASLDFSEAQATIVAISTIFSFIVTSGFMQAIGRDTIHYLSMEKFVLLKKSFYKQIRVGLLTTYVVAIGFVCLNSIAPFYSGRMILIIISYFILMSQLWLFLSLLYVIKHYGVIVLITTLSIIPVYLVMHYTDWGIYVAHFIGLACANISAFAYGYTWLHIKTAGRDQHEHLPKTSIMTYILSPYFIGGLAYFVFLFLDRLVAWSTVYKDPVPYLIWFRTPYELGMDWALISLLLTVAMLECSIEYFSKLLIPKQESLSLKYVQKFRRFFKRFYKKQLILLVIIGSISIIVTYFGVNSLRRFDHIQEIHDFFSNRITFFTFYIAAAGYFFLAIGLLNGLLFYTLSQPGFMLKSIVPGIGVNLTIGILASRWFGYEYAVIGLLAGSIVFALLTMKFAKRYFAHLDYYYYASF